MRRRWLLRWAEWIANRYGFRLVEREGWIRAGLEAGVLAARCSALGLAVRVGEGPGRQARWHELEQRAATIGRALLAAGTRSW